MTDAEIIVDVVRSAVYRKVALHVEVAETVQSLRDGIRYFGSRTCRTQSAWDATMKIVARKQANLDVIERLRVRFESWRT